MAGSLSDWSDGGLRRKTRDRVQKLLLAPLDERIRQKLSLSGLELSTGPASGEMIKPTGPVHPIDMLLELWEVTVEPVLSNAVKEDIKLAKKLRRLEGVGALRETQREEQKRDAIWVSVHSSSVMAWQCYVTSD